MWELLRSTSHVRETSVRSILTCVLAAFIAALVWVAATPQNTFAADVTWNGDSLLYDGNTYVGPAASETVKALNLPDKTTVYTFVEPDTASNRKIHILYFAPGADPGAASSANYRTYTYKGQNSFSDPSTASAVSLDSETVDTEVSSCAVDGGLGWIICPITNTLATWMDWVFDVLASFLEVRPMQTNQENALYRAWSYMRTFANIAFVIAFLIIIYSQLTSYGVSNYGIKKLLPRIIIAAVLVNVSYIICALAIDISNVLGFSIQNLFIDMRNSLVGAEGNSWDALSWESVSSFILSGGALAAGAGIGVLSAIATYGGVAGAALAILLPALVILIVAVLVALLIMAARQAIITVLTILSPLAFVAFLLPNTEKWFDKWRGTFMTMLILFPAFSVIFGGSQLAGSVIIQNADSINLILLGMIVQVAPLFVTPFLIKFSGSLLGRIAGMVNDPNKGIIDRTRNFAKDRAENMKARNLATQAKSWQLGKKTAQRFDHNRRRREGWRNAHNAMADARWANTTDFKATDQVSRRAADMKTLGETLSATAYNEAKLNTNQLDKEKVAIRQLDVDVRAAKLNLENAELDATNQNWERNHAAPIVASKLQQRVLKDTQEALHKQHEADYDEVKAGVTPASMSHVPNIINYSDLARDALRETKIASDRQNNALTEQAGEYADLLKSNEMLARQAGGIRGEQGYLSVLANAKKTASKFELDDIQNIQDTMDYALSSNPDALLDKFSHATTMSERVAYARAVSKNGKPGVQALRQMITQFEGSKNFSPDDMQNFKELLGMQSNVMGLGKDIENWLTNETIDIVDASGKKVQQLRTFTDISKDNKTWLNLSATAFASQNAATHELALDQLYRTDRSGYMRVIDMLRNSPQALAGIKQGVREKFTIYSDEEYKVAASKGHPLPDPGMYTPKEG